MPICRLISVLVSAAVLSAGTSSVRAEPTSGAVTITQLRPYIGSNSVYVYLAGVGPCGSEFGGAYAIYKIDVSTPSGKAAYAAALMAVAVGKQVMLEVIAGACGTQYPGLQSIYVSS